MYQNILKNCYITHLWVSLPHSNQVHARTETQDDDIRKAFSSMKEEGKLLSCDTSVKKLLQVLEKDEFKSGEHIDFFEVWH